MIFISVKYTEFKDKNRQPSLHAEKVTHAKKKKSSFPNCNFHPLYQGLGQRLPSQHPRRTIECDGAGTLNCFCPQNSSSASSQASRYHWIRRDSAGRPTAFSAHTRPEDTDAPSCQRRPILSRNLRVPGANSIRTALARHHRPHLNFHPKLDGGPDPPGALKAALILMSSALGPGSSSGIGGQEEEAPRSRPKLRPRRWPLRAAGTEALHALAPSAVCCSQVTAQPVQREPIRLRPCVWTQPGQQALAPPGHALPRPGRGQPSSHPNTLWRCDQDFPQTSGFVSAHGNGDLLRP